MLSAMLSANKLGKTIQEPSSLFIGSHTVIQGMRRYQHWEEIQRYFGDSRAERGMGVTIDLKLSDMKSNDDNKIHGSGRRVVNTSEGITPQVEKKAEAARELNICIIMDAQLYIENGRFHSVVY